MKQLKRKYKLKDADMLEASAALQNIFVENMIDFSTFDSSLDINFANLWLAKIKEAYALAQNSQIKDIQKQKTSKVLQLLKECKTKYHKVKFFAFKAYQANDKHRVIFGINTFSKAKIKPSEMIAFMNTLYTACKEHQTHLLAQGMKLADIESIAVLRDQLTNSYTDSQNYKKVKKQITHERKKVLNQCYGMTSLVIKAASIVYNEDFAKKKMFVFDSTK